MTVKKGFILPILAVIVGLVVVISLIVVNKKTNNYIETANPAEVSEENTDDSFISSAITAIPTKKSSETAKNTPTPKPDWYDDPVDTSNSCGTWGQGGIDYPPFPAIGKAPLPVTLFSGGCGTLPASTKNLTITGCQWDMDGDGVWDTGINGGCMATLTYPKNGVYKPVCRVSFSNNSWGRTCPYAYEIKVGDSIEFENDRISIDKLSLEVTIRRSSPEYEFHPRELSQIRSDYYYNRPGIVVSAKGNSVTLKIENSGDDFGIYETGYSYLTNAVSAARLHLFIAKSKPNGTYEGTAKVNYTRDGKMQDDGPTVNYKITLMD